MSKPPDFYVSDVASWTLREVEQHVLFRLRMTYLTHTGLDTWLTNYVVRKKLSLVNEVFENMAKSTKSQSGSSASWGGYVNIRLSEVELDAYDAYVIKEKVRAEQSVAFLLARGKLSIQYTNDAFNATLTCEYDGKIWGLSAFSDDWIDAVNLLAYKVTHYPEWYKNGSVKSKAVRG